MGDGTRGRSKGVCSQAGTWSSYCFLRRRSHDGRRRSRDRRATRWPSGPQPGLSASSSVRERRGAEMDEEGELQREESGVRVKGKPRFEAGECLWRCLLIPEVMRTRGRKWTWLGRDSEVSISVLSSRKEMGRGWFRLRFRDRGSCRDWDCVTRMIMSQSLPLYVCCLEHQRQNRGFETVKRCAA